MTIFAKDYTTKKKDEYGRYIGVTLYGGNSPFAFYRCYEHYRPCRKGGYNRKKNHIKNHLKSKDSFRINKKGFLEGKMSVTGAGLIEFPFNNSGVINQINKAMIDKAMDCKDRTVITVYEKAKTRYIDIPMKIEVQNEEIRKSEAIRRMNHEEEKQ